MNIPVLASLVHVVTGVCLEGGIPPHERKNLEIFGFNISLGSGTSSPSSFYALSGCTDPTSAVNQGCNSEAVSKYHISMEIWVDLYPLAWQSLQDKYPNVAAKNLGNMGYDGVVSAFIPKPVQKEAYKTEGVALQYFRNWNASWYQPSKYFDSISMISTALIRPCSDPVSNMQDDASMRRHIHFTGDANGTVFNSTSGSYSARCDDGYWWIAPSCRANTSLCVPYVMAGPGWSLEEYMQKATIWNMPFALGVAASWSAYTEFPFIHPKLQI